MIDMLRKIRTFEQWENEVLDGRWVLVEFFATWCPHCQRMQPIVEELGDEIDTDDVKICQIDVDEMPDVARLFASATPTFVLFHDGTPKKVIEGEQTLLGLRELVYDSVGM